MLSRRALPALLAAPAFAQTFPTRPVTLICPWPPGGGADAQMRALAVGASRHLGERVIIENRPGAVGTLGLAALMQARADGYMLSQITNAALRQPFITRTPFDPLADFLPILGVTAFEFGIVVQAAHPARDMAGLIAAARAAPHSYGSFGIGSPPHVAMDRIAAAAGIEWTHLPFRGTAENIAALLGGHIQITADGTGWAPHVEAGRFRLLAVMGRRRLSRWPDVPRLMEAGFEVEEFSPWGIVAPRGLEPAIARRLHDAFRAGMAEPEFGTALATLAQEPLYMSGPEYAEYLAARAPREREIVDRYGLRQS